MEEVKNNTLQPFKPQFIVLSTSCFSTNIEGRD